MDVSKMIEETETILAKTAKSIRESKRSGGPGGDRLMPYARILNSYRHLCQLQNPKKGQGDDILAGMSPEERAAYCAVHGDPDYIDSLYESEKTPPPILMG